MPNKKDQQEPVCAVYCVHDQIVKEAKEQMLIPVQAIRLAETFKILGDPNRVQLINILAGREICVCDIAVILGISGAEIALNVVSVYQEQSVCSIQSVGHAI